MFWDLAARLGHQLAVKKRRKTISMCGPVPVPFDRFVTVLVKKKENQ